MTVTPLEAMRAAQAVAVRAKRDAVEQALADTLAERAPITIGGIAKRAQVSRQFLYNHPDLKKVIEAATKAPQPAPPRPANFDSVERGLKAERHTLAAKTERQRQTIKDLRAQVEDLETQRRRWLGSQLQGQEVITAEEHTELRLTLDRFMSENQSLLRRISELQRLNAMLEDDLRASRSAHAEDMAKTAPEVGGTVTSITATPRNAEPKP